MVREERVFWGVLVGFVVLLLGVGVLKVVFRGEPRAEAYLPDESTPEAVVYNAYVAARRQDVDRFFSYFSADVWDTRRTKVRRLYTNELDRGQLDIGKGVVEDGQATVPVMLVMSYSRGLFGSEVVVRREQVRLRRENGRWVITVALPFVYPAFESPVVPVPPPTGGD